MNRTKSGIVTNEKTQEQEVGAADDLATTGRLNRISEVLLDALAQRVAQAVLKVMLPRIEASIRVRPRWLSLESAASYIDKTYEGMRYTITRYEKELPIVMLGDKPRIDIEDIDRFMLNRKGK